MTHPEYQYLKLIAKILKKGKSKKTRGIHGIRSIFGEQLKFDLRYGFPLLTTKKMPFSILVYELLWFISGDTNIQYLNDHNIRYWDGFADKNGNLGPVYGYQWRKWPAYVPFKPSGDKQDANLTDSVETDANRITHYITADGEKHEVKNNSSLFQPNTIDQLKNVINEIKNTPDSKYMMVTAVNPAMKDEMRLPPCHAFYQFNVTKGKLRLQMYQRSSDVFLGLPFNIAQYALLLVMVAHVTGTEARELVISIGDAHLYKNHIEVAKKQLTRKPFDFPSVEINKEVKNVDGFTKKDISLVGYKAHPRLKTDLVIV